MFKDYVKKNDDTTTILFIYLLLNGYKLENIKKIVKHIDNPKNFPNAYTEILYAETTEAVDITEINKEVNSIIVPTICTEATFQLYTDFNEIICYTPENKAKKLYVDDLDIISAFMIIQENMIVTTSMAKSLGEATHGLMCFVEYVLTSECRIGKWHIKYLEENKEFIISYINDNKSEQVCYKAQEYDKVTTFRLVLYVTKKACEQLDKNGNWKVSENYKTERYSRIVSEK
jgi:hypothetical protein